jgi:hypothetical protein
VKRQLLGGLANNGAGVAWRQFGRVLKRQARRWPNSRCPLCTTGDKSNKDIASNISSNNEEISSLIGKSVRHRLGILDICAATRGSSEVVRSAKLSSFNPAAAGWT